jgi:hypothetical protein
MPKEMRRYEALRHIVQYAKDNHNSPPYALLADMMKISKQQVGRHIADLIKERYALYLSLISSTGTTSSPAFIVLDAPVDAITGA